MIKIKSLINFQIYFVLICYWLVSDLHLPAAIKYIPDVVTILLAIFMVTARNNSELKRKNSAKNQTGIALAVLVFFVYSLFSSLAAGVSPLFFVWAVRVTFRFYIFYFACVHYLNIGDVEHIFNQMEKLYVVNMILIVYQFFVVGLRQDFLGGIFGTQQGCNGFMNIFIVVMLSYQVTRYYHKEIDLKYLVFYLFSSLLMAAMAEIKFLFIETVIIIALALVFNRPSAKTIGFVSVAAVAVLIGLQVLEQVFPSAYMLLFEQDALDSYLAAGWTGGKELGRTTAIPFINEKFFSNDTILKLFGLGFGNCETSGFFATPFAQLYASTRYRNFTFAMQYLETGYVGLILYALFFVLVFISAFKSVRKPQTKKWACFIRVLIPMTAFNIWYNDTCKADIAYLLFFSIAVLAIAGKDDSNNTTKGAGELI